MKGGERQEHSNKVYRGPILNRKCYTFSRPSALGRTVNGASQSESKKFIGFGVSVLTRFKIRIARLRFGQGFG